METLSDHLSQTPPTFSSWTDTASAGLKSHPIVNVVELDHQDPAITIMSKVPDIGRVEVRFRPEDTPPQTRVPSPVRSAPLRSHAEFVRTLYQRLSMLRDGAEVVLDGQSLTIPDVVAIAK